MSEAGVYYTCQTCKAKSRVQKDLKHAEDCKKKQVTGPTCEH